MSKRERAANYAKEFKEQAARTEQLFSSLKTKMIPEIDQKYKQFCHEEQQFLKNYYDPDYRSSEYVKKLLNSKN